MGLLQITTKKNKWHRSVSELAWGLFELLQKLTMDAARPSCHLAVPSELALR
jgi:hypothetical protein